MATERTYAGRSAQERRDSRRRALLDAGLELIGTQGWTQTSVRGVYQLAGVSPRFFYESFASLDALAVAVYDEIASEATADVIAAASTAEAATVIGTLYSTNVPTSPASTPPIPPGTGISPPSSPIR